MHTNRYYDKALGTIKNLVAELEMATFCLSIPQMHIQVNDNENKKQKITDWVENLIYYLYIYGW